ncbi:TipAS antibiotic-recognition domain-containing protein [Deinococcus malanensis]|uniref:TipAS antibiotic-recognition domain-containing protein n=1 Tax=Deinococcus malanensis TaxID=1706855 RepID=UPI00362B87C2
MSSQDLRDMFDGFDPAQYESEVQERWGDTDACRQTDERTRNYTRADWAQLKEEGEKLTSAYLTLMDRGFCPRVCRRSRWRHTLGRIFNAGSITPHPT